MTHLRHALRQRLFAAAGALLLAAPVAASEPAALVINVVGETTPAVDMFSEVEQGTAIALADGAEIEFLHYRTCEAVTVHGGRLTFTAERYTVQKGKIADVKRASCPKSVALGGPSQIGGLNLRSAAGDAKLKVPAAPVFVLVGSNADAYSRIRVADGGNTVLEGRFDGRAFRWPDDAPPLDSAKEYDVTVASEDGSRSEEFTIRPGGRGKAEAVTLIRLD